MNKLYAQFKFTANILLFFTILVSGVIGIRYLLFDDWKLMFLIWNLILCWVPYTLSLIIYKRKTVYRHSEGFLNVLMSIFWLLFFPNSIYMVTDFVHIQRLDIGMSDMSDVLSTVQWMHFAILIVAILIGMVIGFMSLYIMHNLVDASYGPLISWAFSSFTLLISSYGIYLGRMPGLRNNSWDILWPPNLINKLLPNILGSFNMDMVAFVVLFFVFLLTMFILTYNLWNMRKNA